MALSQSFSTSENTLGTIIYVDDDTGLYTINTTGGYGSPNTERTDLALIAFLEYKASTGDVVQTIQTYDPEVVTQFEWQGISANSNGWYQATIYTFNKKTGAETPSTGDYVYDFTADELQRWSGAAWVAIAEASWKTQIESDALTPTATKNHMHLSGYYKAFNYMVKLIATGCSCRTVNELRSYRNEVKEQLDGFRIHFCEGSRTQAQLDAERYNDRIAELLALE